MFVDVALLASPSPTSTLMSSPSPTSTLAVTSSAFVSTSLNGLMNLIVNLDLLGGAVWIVWGTVVLASSLKDKNGPGLQSGTWQIVGGLMIMVATYLFRNMSTNEYLLRDVMRLGVAFCTFGGALWTIWGVIILAGALRDKTGPVLQSAIWQIVGGLMIMAASTLFGTIVR